MDGWTVHVTGFGKIEKADIQVAPLTLFIGDNNSGKSYMMTLIYGLLQVQFYFDKYEFPRESAAYRSCCEIMRRMLKTDEEQGKDYYLAGEEMKAFQALLNEMLNTNKEKFLTELFNRRMEMGELRLEFPEDAGYNFWVEEDFDTSEQKQHRYLNSRDDTGRLMSGYVMGQESFDKENGYDFFLSYVMQHMIRKGFRKNGRADVIYFPTARTGFLLTYKALIESAMQDKFNLQKKEKNLLTKPNSDFLTRLSSMSAIDDECAYQDIVRFIEEQVISGHISVSELPTHDILYTPEGEENAIPMFVTSAVVTEMAPLLLFLQHENIGTLLMEEPEISLHPELQWAIARVLIRLINEGVPVFVTTHSDIILQHINNMLRLQNRKNTDSFLNKMGYERQDLISREEVAVYQFDVQNRKYTKITRVLCGDYGFEAMTFYHTLEKLNHQINRIDEMEEVCFQENCSED